MKRSLIKLIKNMTNSSDFNDPWVANYLKKHPEFELNETLINEIKLLDCDVKYKARFFISLIKFYSVRYSLYKEIFMMLICVEGTNRINYENFIPEWLELYEVVCDDEFPHYKPIIRGKNFTEIIDEAVKIYSASNTDNTTKNIEEMFAALKVRSARKNIVEFAKEISKLEGKELEEFYSVNYDFGINDDFDRTLIHLLVCETAFSDQDLINIISKLLYLGMLPKYKTYSYEDDFICLAVEYGQSSYFIKEIIKKTYEICGFLPDERIFDLILEKPLYDALEIYKLLYSYGFTLFKEEFNSYSHNEQFAFQTSWGKNNYEEAQELTKLTKIQCIITDLINGLKRKYKIEDTFKEKLDIDDFDNYILIEQVCNISGELWENFSILWANTIIENRNNSINSINTEITANEAIDALKTILYNSTEFINNKLDEQKNKIMTYKK